MNLAKIARQVVEDAGVDVDKLLELLVKNASAELTTYFYYTHLRVNSIGYKGENLKEIAEDARIEDRNHFETIVLRIYELGGEIPNDLKEFHDISGYPPAKLPEDENDIEEILEVLVGAERCAVQQYTNIFNMTAGKDLRTYDLAKAILHGEVQHEAWFSEYLEEGPSGRFKRGEKNSPYVSKFLE